MAEHELTCGIEIHQQLDTKKLFCSCDTELVDEPGLELYRRLRPTQSELGEVDRAALAQAERGMRFRYLAPSRVSCLVEADEEPPHDADAQAIEATLTFSTLLGAKVVDEVHFMRKIVIDGSNTTGFQRTALVAVDGSLEFDGKRISIQSICLEEDAARKMEAKGQEVTYKLDRLGMPLIEVATGPDMHTPEEVREVAARLGSLLRATKMVKRGLGTIREDLNISIPGGARVEVKGVQELRMLPEYVQKEVDRQRALLQVMRQLSSRRVVPARLSIKDLTDILRACRSKVVAGAISKGGKVMGASIPGFEGTMRSADGRLRLGAEMAQRAKMRAGVMGIFHSDELPGYGITPEEVGWIRSALAIEGAGAFVICADEPSKAEAALRAAVERANMALEGVPEETRDPLPDGSTSYSRPLPGASRMYPETDVKPITITQRRLDEVRSKLPELPEQKVLRFVTKYGIHEQQARQIVRDGYEELFEEAAAKYDLSAAAARTLLSTLPEIQKEGADISKLDDAALLRAFTSLHEGRFAKEAMPQVLKKMCEGRSIDEAVNELGLQRMDSGEAEAVVAAIVKEREAFVREKGLGAVGPLMGPVMERLRGKVDGRTASELLKKEISRLLQS